MISMENSSGQFNVQSVPEAYVMPPEVRPAECVNVPLSKNIPVIDLACHDRNQIIQEIMKASQEYGFFQVINHGVSKSLMYETLSVFKEFHSMPAKDRAAQCWMDPNGRCKFYTSSEKHSSEKVHYWRDALVHNCHPLQECMHFWPQNPIRYSDVVGRYSLEATNLGSKTLELICEGLGVRKDYFRGGLAGNPVMLVNHYPPCPDPSLTLGLAKHRDPSVITILLQGDVYGLQVLKDNEWIGVEPLPHAFLVNIGYILQIISNGKLVGAEHRVVTNRIEARTTASLFLYPSDDSLIEPAKALVDDCHPPSYNSFKHKDFLATYMSNAGLVKEFICPSYI